MKIGYVGSFDPFTNGHYEVYHKAREMSSDVVIVVANNANKKHFLSADVRKELIIKSTGNSNVVVLPDNMYAVNYLETLDCTHIIRGIRDVTDVSDELLLSGVNKDINAKIETIFIPTDNPVSSSMVRSLVGYASWVDAVKDKVPFEVLRYLKYHWLKSFIPPEVEFPLDYDQEGYHTWEHSFNIAYNLHNAAITEAWCFADVIIPDMIAAAIYHDVVPTPTEALKVYSSNMFNESSKVRDMILATDYSEEFAPNSLSPTSMRFVIEDLRVLALPSKDYLNYRYLLRREYKDCSDEEFCKGRLDFLRKFLARKHIFPTVEHLDSDKLFGIVSNAQVDILEELARENISGEIYWLEADLRGDVF